MKRVIDTNILLDHPQIAKEDNIIISIEVLSELDRLKLERGEIGQKARVASQMLRKYKDHIDFDMCYGMPSVDDQLIQVAKAHKASIVTNDIIMELKCKAEGVDFKPYYDDSKLNGIFYLFTPEDDEVISQLYEGQLQFPPHENEYICIMDRNQPYTRSDGEIDYKCVDILQYKKGEFRRVFEKTINSDFLAEITPRNPEQTCLINSLYDKETTILYAGGTWGVGKSFLIVSYALQELEKGHINKIVFVPNNAVNENARDPGTLPGGLFEKESAFMGTLCDILSEDKVESMYYDEGTLDIMPIGLARGRNIENSIIIVNEAQNLTEEHVKLLIARCGEGTKICFDGDFRQADSHIFRSRSGLKLLLKLKGSPKFAPIFSSINLIHTERSLTAQAATFLDEIEY